MTNAEESAQEESAEHFAANTLPLYQGPTVKLRIQPSNKEYIISKDLLCAESPVFSAMFNGEFRESQEQAVTLEETEDVVAVRSVEALCQWLYRRVVRFGIEDPTEHITAAMELVRLADMYDVTELGTTMAQYIKNFLISNPDPGIRGLLVPRHDSNTYFLRREHIASAILLPQYHPVRKVLAAASVEGFLRTPHHKFSEETQAYPSFGADLLREIRITLHETNRRTSVIFKDPISGSSVELGDDSF
ncbi:uncharacterized protein N7515_000670 [Penicillium bovifimosum]|uniref:BTB domain-containing protein n=1 Tax=Penicillium bovifimosum TaxID=126998 RepID=A0A9W9HFD4_9EURO|nr:uncharacterized protein N7515_000670 [Penicillium bovifimosum]KAJ5146106.1 hypothetical protein N7515_000670 [Penicillium bovifimosum]